MASIVEFLVKIKDMASSPLRSIGTTGDASFNRLEQGIRRVTGRAGTLRSSIQDLNRKINDLRKTREISLDGRQIRRINAELEQLERRRNRLEGGANGGGGLSMRGLVAGAMAMAGVAGFGGIISAGMDKTMNNKSFEVMAGAKPGRQLAGNLQGYAQDTIYGNEVQDIGKMMLGFGIKADGVIPAVTRLGDLAIGNAEKFKSLGLVYSQVAAQGKLMGQDNMQFINAGFNPLQELSRTTGKSMSVLKQQMSEGKISFNDVALAITTATSKGGRFYNMTNQLAETAPGKLLGLQGAFEGLTASVGVGALEMMVPLIDFGNWLVESPNLLTGLAAGLATVAIAYGIYSAVVNWATICATLFNIAAFWPIALIAVLVGAIVYMLTKYQGWGAALNALWIVIKAFCSMVGIAFKDFFQEVIFRAELFWLKIKEHFQNVAGLVGNVMKALALASQFKFAEAKAALTAEVKAKATAEIETLKNSREVQKKANVKAFVDNLQTIKKTDIIGNIKENKNAKKPNWQALAGGKLTGASGGADGDISKAKSAKEGITGGGVRNLTISIGKLNEKIEIHTTNLKEGSADIERQMIELLLRVTNSANAATAE